MTKPFRYTITPRGEVRLEMNDTTFFLNRRRAAELLRTIGAAVREQGAGNGLAGPDRTAMIAGIRPEWQVQRQIRGEWVPYDMCLGGLKWTCNRDDAELVAAVARELGFPTRILVRYVTEPEEA